MRTTLNRKIQGRTADGSPLKELYYAFVINDQQQVIEVKQYEFAGYKPEELYAVRLNLILSEIRKCEEELKRNRVNDVVLERLKSLHADDSYVSKPRGEKLDKPVERVGGIRIN